MCGQSQPSDMQYGAAAEHVSQGSMVTEVGFWSVKPGGKKKKTSAKTIHENMTLKPMPRANQIYFTSKHAFLD